MRTIQTPDKSVIWIPTVLQEQILTCDTIENYRPIANLCSASKVFEKLILKQIQYLESKNKLDLTGRQQHGFKRKKSTATAGALLQSLIARAADENCFVVMASLDLSMAFDMVNMELLVKRLMIMGMPNDLIYFYFIFFFNVYYSVLTLKSTNDLN